MGWSSWNHFGQNVNADVIKEAADAMASNGMREAGYVYINLDDGWAVGRDVTNATLIADPKLFPMGIKAVADYVHSKGLKFGLYTARGSRTCLGRPGSDSHEELDAATFAEWGVDYLKEDSCGGKTHGTVWQQYSRMRDALNITGRPIYYSVTQAVPWTDGYNAMHCYGNSVFTIKPWIAAGKDPRTLANSYLIEYCNNEDYFGYTGGVPKAGGFLSQLDSQALLTYDNLTGPGAFNDMDMLQVCNGGQTQAEYRAQFSIWAILSSPLILGNDLTKMDAACKDIILNREVIEISQDPKVVRGKLMYQWPDSTWPNLTGGALGVAPAQTLQLGLEPCNSTAPEQRFRYNSSDGSLVAEESGMCLTYFGYTESNTGLAACEGWVAPGVGGQLWRWANRSLFNVGNGEKCLDVFNCDAKSEIAVQTCTCGSTDCFAASSPQACNEENLHWSLDDSGVISTAIGGGALCLAARPMPHSAMNITMQLWMKPLDDGSVAVVAFNRGTMAMPMTIPWWMLSLATAQTCDVRDLWQQHNLGTFQHQVIIVVEPHDARALKVSNCYDSFSHEVLHT